MKCRILALILGLTALLLLGSATLAQGPEPWEREPQDAPRPPDYRRWADQPDPEAWRPRPQALVEAAVEPAAVTLGEPGLSFRYVDTFGVTEEAYIEDSARFAVPFLRVSQSEDTVEGIAIPNATVNVTVTRGTETFVASTTAEGDGWFVTDGWEFSPEVDIQVDDIVEMSSDGVSRTLTVVAMTGVPSIEFDTISGHVDGASEDDPVRIEIWRSGGATVDTTTDASGNYSTDLGGWDLRAGHELSVWYITGDGDECGITVAYLMIWVALDGDLIDGGTQPTATLNVTLTGSGIKGTATTSSDKDGFYSTNIYTDTTVADIVSGDNIEVTADGRQASVDAILTVQVNAVADTISGYAAPYTDVRVRIDDDGQFWVQSDGTGYYEFDAGAEGINLQPGMGGRVRYITDDGHFVTAGFEVQEYYIYLPLVMKNF